MKRISVVLRNPIVRSYILLAVMMSENYKGDYKDQKLNLRFFNSLGPNELLRVEAAGGRVIY